MAEYKRWDKRRINDVRQELGLPSVNEFVRDRILNWREHVGRIKDLGLPRRSAEYHPESRRHLGRPTKR